jgi:aminoglycoside phosphotransferase family enzyme/predicted kinase
MAQDHDGLVADLLRPEAYEPPVEEVELVETHISWVFLAGAYAYKLKKPVELGFLDFRGLEDRLHFCCEELRLNRRLAPEIYLDLAGAQHGPKGWRMAAWIEGSEPAVRMHRFPADARLDRRLEAGLLGGTELEAFARSLAAFQAEAARASVGQGLGDATAATRPALENFRVLSGPGLGPEPAAQIEALAAWTRQRASALAARFEARLAAGFVREGHGDLHLANLVHLPKRVAAFDGIEFDPALRWIDLQSDVAFLLMDLESRGRCDLGWQFYNAWLAAGGDYEGLDLLDWYLVYRHLVRAKVDGIRLGQPGLQPAEAARLRDRQLRHIFLAAQRATRDPPLLILTSGYSGSGKSWLAARLARLLPAVWLRSDVERKRLHGLDPLTSAAALPGAGLYSEEATARTYARLAELARTAIGAGLHLVVDAAFLDSRRREEFLRLGTRLGARPVVLACMASPELLRQRVAGRRGDPSDAGLAVLESQLGHPIEIGNFEAGLRIEVDTSREFQPQALAGQLLRRRRAG